jgi:MoxR-like ATPase
MNTTAAQTKSTREDFLLLRSGLTEHIVGQQALVDRLLVALLCAGHLIVEGAPGLAKTRAVKALASGLDADFHRIQFTPDLLPADLTGSDVFRPVDGTFDFQPGPIFHSVLLADEINRAPAKVQSALLEAMGEGQVTAGANTYPLPPLFMVMATQNPIEQEGTYPLPEAQLDRFMLHVVVDYPDRDAGRQILQLARREAIGGQGEPRLRTKLSQDTVFAARHEVLTLHLADAVEAYIVELIEATRAPAAYDAELASWIRWGASPRGAIALERGARALAWLAGRDFVTPEDVQNIAPDVLRHRLILNFEAEADGVSNDRFVSKLLSRVPAP